MAAPFVDTARITVKAGSGGNGAVAFHREKYVAAGGPDGGDGGRGGSVILEINEHMSTLMDFRYKRKYVAANGMDGQGKRCSGKDGEDLVIKVPRGTVVRDAETGEIICDMSPNRPLCAGQGWERGLGQQALRHPHPAGAPLCQGGPAWPGAAGDSGTQAAGRRGPGGLPQCGSVTLGD